MGRSDTWEKRVNEDLQSTVQFQERFGQTAGVLCSKAKGRGCPASGWNEPVSVPQQAHSLGGSLWKGWSKYEGDSRYRGPTAVSAGGLNDAFLEPLQVGSPLH